MKCILFIILLFAFAVNFAAAPGISWNGRFSFKDFKKELKKDSSEGRNAELAAEVLSRGVSFRYTLDRENKLRRLGAKDTLINAIFQSVADERAEQKLFKVFMDSYDSADRDTRKAALEKGKLYLSRFEKYERFGLRVNLLKKELRFLECEFDPSLGC